MPFFRVSFEKNNYRLNNRDPPAGDPPLHQKPERVQRGIDAAGESRLFRQILNLAILPYIF